LEVDVKPKYSLLDENARRKSDVAEAIGEEEEVVASFQNLPSVVNHLDVGLVGSDIPADLLGDHKKTQNLEDELRNQCPHRPIKRLYCQLVHDRLPVEDSHLQYDYPEE